MDRSRWRDALGELLAESTQAPPPHTPRRVYGAVQLAGRATAIVGIRRAGKTTFAHQLRAERMAQGVDARRLPYISFEDERLAGLAAADLSALLDDYQRGLPESPVMWCFDEIQVVPGWERFVRRLLDRAAAEVCVTGSSAALLSREIATSLRGRAWRVLMHPFSFAEAVRHGRDRAPEAWQAAASWRARGVVTNEERLRLERAFQDWLAVGGFPEVQALDTETRRRLLTDAADVAMLRDVVERHEVRNVTALRWLMRHLLGNPASLFSIEKFHAALKSQGVAVGKDTLHQLLGHLEDCFLVRVVWIESRSERKRMVNPRKAYPVDTGFLPIFARAGGGMGQALETAVLVELERRGCDVTYVRTPGGFEVDFLARAGDGSEELVQVCADLSHAPTRERELRALADAGTAFPAASKRLLTLTRDAPPMEAPPDVVVQPAYEWMLA